MCGWNPAFATLAGMTTTAIVSSCDIAIMAFVEPVRHLSQGLPDRLAQLTRWPVVVAGRRLFGDRDDPPQPDRPYQAHFPPGTGGKAPVSDRLGRAHGA